MQSEFYRLGYIIDNNMKTTPPAGTKRTLSLRLKIWFAFILVFTPIYIFVFGWYYMFSVRRAVSALYDEISQIVNVDVPNMDVENFKALYQEQSQINPDCPPNAVSSRNGYYPESDPLFIAHMNWIKSIIQKHPDTRIYTYIKGPEYGDVIIIGSSEYFHEPRNGLAFCEVYNSRGRSRIYDGLTTRIDVWTPYSDIDGSWIATYAPIKDQDGAIVGAIGIEISAGEIVSLKSALLNKDLAVFIFAYIIMFLAVQQYTKIVAARRMAAQLKKRPKQFSSVERHGSVFSMFPDEIDVLIESMQTMLENLNRQRDELIKSRAQMQELVQSTLRVQETERRFVAHELHDEAGQLLVSLRYTIETLLTDLPAEDAKSGRSSRGRKTTREQLSVAIRQIDETLATIRALSHKMRPALLDVGDINLAMQEYCNEFKQNKKWDVVYEGAKLSDPPEDVALALFRFLQEALTNIVKHATPTEVRVRLTEENDWITLSVFDNDGNVKADLSTDGIGILGMRERFNLLGGVVEVNPGPEGFLIQARVPSRPGAEPKKPI
jgi:signal transduction histidine kinase